MLLTQAYGSKGHRKLLRFGQKYFYQAANHFLLPFVFSARTESALHNLCISFTLRVTLELRKRTTNSYSKMVHTESRVHVPCVWVFGGVGTLGMQRRRGECVYVAEFLFHEKRLFVHVSPL